MLTVRNLQGAFVSCYVAMTCFLVYSSWHRKDTTQWADWFWLQQDWLANRLGTWAAKLASTSDGFPEATGKQEGDSAPL
jgi:hypothetical protein